MDNTTRINFSSSNTDPDLSIVIPVHNEEENISLLYKSLVGVLEGLSKNCEIIFVDDGSTDGTFQRLLQLKQELDSNSRKSLNLQPQLLSRPHLRLIRFKRNFGQTAAMQAGFDHAKGDIVISMDGDLQNDPKNIPKLIEKLGEGYDVVCGWRKHRKDKTLTRIIPSKIANWLIGLVTGVKIHDNGCSLRAFRSSIIKNTILYSDMHRFIPTMTTLSGARITEIVVKHHPRKYGKTKYGLGRVWKVFFDIISIKMLVSFSEKPAIWFGFLSLPFLVLALLFLYPSLLNYFKEGTSSIVFLGSSFLCFSIFFQLLLSGFLSEYIIRVEKSKGV